MAMSADGVVRFDGGLSNSDNNGEVIGDRVKLPDQVKLGIEIGLSPSFVRPPPQAPCCRRLCLVR